MNMPGVAVNALASQRYSSLWTPQAPVDTPNLRCKSDGIGFLFRRGICFMAKGTKFLPPIRHAGDATGQVECRITLPALSDKITRSFGYGYRDGVRQSRLTRLRRFVREELPKAEAALEDATIVVVPRVRKSSGAIGWTQLAKWRVGESLDAFLDQANEGWLRLPKEEGWGATIGVELQPPSVARTRRRR